MPRKVAIDLMYYDRRMKKWSSNVEKGFRSTRLGLSLRIDRFSRKDIVFLTILRVVLKNNSYRVELPQEFLYIFYLERAVERVVISNNMNRGGGGDESMEQAWLDETRILWNGQIRIYSPFCFYYKWSTSAQRDSLINRNY